MHPKRVRIPLTYQMVGVLLSLLELGSKPADPSWFVPNSLIRLAKEGFIRIGRRVTLTRKGEIRAHFLSLKHKDGLPCKWKETK
jgi:hypothetical protein